MQKSEIVNSLKDSAIEIMEKDKIPASLIVAEALRILNSHEDIVDKLIEINNPFAIKAVYKKQKRGAYYDQNKQAHYRKFDSMTEGILKYTESNYLKFEKVKSIYDYEEMLTLYTSDEGTINSLKMFIEGFKLYEMDNTVVKNITSSAKNVIDSETIPENKNTEIYQQQSNYTEPIVKETANHKASKPKPNTLSEKSRNDCDDVIHIQVANLYSAANATMPSRAISGDYYINPNKKPIPPYNRIAIYMKKEFVKDESLCIGYINMPKK